MRTEKKKLPKKVQDFEREAARLRALTTKVHALMKSPEVKKHIDTEIHPQPSEEEKKRSEIIDLFDTFARDWHYVSDQLFILAELSHTSRNHQISLSHLYGLITESNMRMDTLKENVDKAFKLLGLKNRVSEEDRRGLTMSILSAARPSLEG